MFNTLVQKQPTYADSAPLSFILYGSKLTPWLRMYYCTCIFINTTERMVVPEKLPDAREQPNHFTYRYYVELVE